MKTKRFLKSAFVFVSLFNTLALLLLLCLALPRVVVVSSAPEEETTTTFDDAKKKKETSPGMDWKTTTSSSNNCAAKGFDDPRAIRCEYCRFALKEALDDEEITRECLECCTETTGDAKLMMMMSSQFDRATITACS